MGGDEISGGFFSKLIGSFGCRLPRSLTNFDFYLRGYSRLARKMRR